jgi:hypothetical protein
MASLTRYIGCATLRLTLLALLLVLALAACGAPAQGPSGALAGEAPALDSCALLTQADAEALLGAPIAAPSTNRADTGDPNDPRAMSQCLYHTTGDTYKSVSVLIRCRHVISHRHTISSSR